MLILCAQDALKRSAEKTKEEQRLGSILRDLRERRAIASMEALSRWDEDKFAASSRYETESEISIFRDNTVSVFMFGTGIGLVF